MIIYINGRGMNAPELKAYISELEVENAELRAKVESAERQKAEYKRLLKAAVEDFSYCSGIYRLYYYNIGCDVCVDRNNTPCYEFRWRYADEALALIGEDGDTECQ